MADKVYVYKDARGFYRWNRRAGNGEIVSESGEGYVSKSYTIHMAEKMNSDVKEFVITNGDSHGEDE